MKKMTAKQIKGWAAFVIFAATCVFLGEGMLLNRSLNMALVLILVVSVLVAWLMNGARPDPADEKKIEIDFPNLDGAG